MPRRPKSFEELVDQRDEYDPESRQLIDSMMLEKQELAKMQTMIATPGWKIMERRIREDLVGRIYLLIKDDANIQSLLGLLTIGDVRTRSRVLADEIEKTLSED